MKSFARSMLVALTFIMASCASTNPPVTQSAWVKVGFTIMEDGTVSELTVLDSSGPKAFEAAALHAVSKWKYKPAYKDGVAVKTPNQAAVVNFKLAE